LEKHKDLVVSMADDLIKNETIVYNRIKELFPNELENSLVCEGFLPNTAIPNNRNAAF